MQGMTLKQWHRTRFLSLCKEYHEAKKNIASDKEKFILLSVQIHAAKNHVPKKWWSLV